MKPRQPNPPEPTCEHISPPTPAHVPSLDNGETRTAPPDGIIPGLQGATASDNRTGPFTPGSPPSPSVPGYEIEAVLGRGGMGVVYKALHLSLKRTVALKMVLAGGHAGPRELGRFRIEAEAVARLQHPNIVQIHEVGEVGGHPYCALEFVEGGNLASKLDGKPMPAREAAKLVELLARAMQLAHSRNVVHRDLKPANILLAADGTPKITDFGLARQLDSDSGETQAGMVVGTPSYMAPEQASGRAHEAGPAADVYALGAILYDCLAGRPPFKGKSVVETLDQVRTQEPVPPSRWQPGVPLDLETICLKCLRKEPENRYASAAELADELVRYQQGEPILARPVRRIERAVKWVRRNPVVASLMAGVVLVLVVGIAVSTGFALEAGRQAAAEKEASRNLGLERDRVSSALAQITEEKQQVAAQKQLAEDATKEKGRQLLRAQDNLITSQLLRVGGLVSREPLSAQQLLHDRKICPIESRDHAWQLFERASRRRLIRRFVPPPEFPLTPSEGFDIVAFSPDGRTLAASGNIAELPIIQIWDVNTGKERITLKGEQEPLVTPGFAYSPDGQHLAGTFGGSIRLWETGTWKEVGKLTAEKHKMLALAFTPDGRTLVSLGGTPTPEQPLEIKALEVKLWDVATRKVRATLKGYRGTLSSLAVSPDGRMLATTPGDTTIQLWNLETAQELATLAGHPTTVYTVAFSPDSRTLVASGGDMNKTAEIKFWDMGTKRERFSIPVPGKHLSAVRFSPDGLRVASASIGAVELWDAISGQQLAVFEESSLRGGSSILALAFSPDGRTLASGPVHDRGGSTMIDLWEVPSGLEHATLRGHTDKVYELAYSPDSRTLASAGVERIVKLWDLATGRVRATLRGHTGEVYRLAFSPEGATLATSSADTTVILWDAATGLQRFALRGHAGPVLAVSFSPDGQTLATGSNDKSVKLWEVSSGKLSQTLTGHDSSVRILMFSSDGRRLASGTFDKGSIKVWDVASGKELAAFESDYQKTLPGIEFSTDGRTLSAQRDDGAVRRWEIESGKELDVAVPDRRYARTSPDGQTGLTRAPGFVGVIEPVRLWHVASGQERATLRGHSNTITENVISPDGRVLATCSLDHTIKLWDLSTSPERALLPCSPGKHVVAQSFSPDGRCLAVAEESGHVKLWDVASATEIATLAGTPMDFEGRKDVGFSPDGRRLVVRDAADKVLVWDVASRRQVQEPTPANVRAHLNSPDGRWGTQLDGPNSSRIWLIDRNWTPPHLPPRPATADPNWHIEQAEDSERAGRWFAAGFHRGKLADLAPWDSALRMQEAQAWAKAEQLERAAVAFVRAALAFRPVAVR